MFSSNQILRITNIASKEEIAKALTLAIQYDGITQERIVRNKWAYQIIGNSYFIGEFYDEIYRGWTEFEFDFDIDIISAIIAKKLSELGSSFKMKVEEDIYDSSADYNDLYRKNNLSYAFAVFTACDEEKDFSISGDNVEDIEEALSFALNFNGDISNYTKLKNPLNCIFKRKPENTEFLVTTSVDEFLDEDCGWCLFPFSFDIKIMSMIINKYLEKQDIDDEGWDGSYHKGFLLSIEKKEPFDIITFSPYTTFYSK